MDSLPLVTLIVTVLALLCFGFWQGADAALDAKTRRCAELEKKLRAAEESRDFWFAVWGAEMSRKSEVVPTEPISEVQDAMEGRR